MYNFNFEENEELIKIFDPIYIKEGNVEKNTAIAVTNKRILFMGFPKDDPLDDMIPGEVIGVIKFKKVFFEYLLLNVEKIENGELFKITMYNGSSFEFENEELYKILVNQVNSK